MRFTKTLMLAAAVVAAPAAAQAADLYVPAPPVVAAPMVSGLWEGPYVGVHVGYITAEADHILQLTTGDGNDISPSGWLLGAQVGANFYLSDAVVGGVVADISWSNASETIDPFTEITHAIDWDGSLRAKLGFDGGNFMPYITGGLAAAGATRSSGGDSDSQTHIGWTIGAGVDVAVADNVSLNLEYRYSNYGEATYDTPGPDAVVGLTSHAIRAGVNFHF